MKRERFEEGFRTVRFEGDEPSEILDQAYKLRHEVFGEELRWVLVNDQNKETDPYDSYSAHFIVLPQNSKEIAGYIRIIPPGSSFMLENEFRDLLSSSARRLLDSRRQESAEVSRAVLQKNFRGGHAGLLVNMCLYREIYHWCLEN